MRISELLQREDFHGLLASTLQTTWSQQHGEHFTVSRSPTPKTQVWLLNRGLSCLHTADIAQGPRQFISDLSRYSPKLWRRPLQHVVVNVLSHPWVMAHGNAPSLWVSPHVPNAQHQLILPGNRRVRLFDFMQGKSRVALKAGYPKESIEREVSIRGNGNPGPFAPITAHNLGQGWFEEPILDAMPIVRLAGNQAARYGRVAQVLSTWLDAHSSTARTTEHLERVRNRSLEILSPQPQGPNLWQQFTEILPTLWQSAVQLGQPLRLSLSHGDFQGGNILELRDGSIVLTDWEYAGRRFYHYDALCLVLGGRFTNGLAQRLQHFIEHGAHGPLPCLLPNEGRDPKWRRAAVAMWAIEDFCFRAEEMSAEALLGSYVGLQSWLQQCAQFVRSKV